MKLAGHCARRIATAIPDIEINAVAAAGYRVSATAKSAVTVVFTAAIARVAITPIALSCRLILRRESAIRIAHAVSGAQIPAMAAGGRVGISPVLDLLNRGGGCVRLGSGRGHLK